MGGGGGWERVYTTVYMAVSHLVLFFTKYVTRKEVIFDGCTGGCRDGICKLLRRPGIDYKESISPGYKGWRAGTTSLFLLGSYTAHRDCYKIPAQSRQGCCPSLPLLQSPQRQVVITMGSKRPLSSSPGHTHCKQFSIYVIPPKNLAKPQF